MTEPSYFTGAEFIFAHQCGVEELLCNAHPLYRLFKLVVRIVLDIIEIIVFIEANGRHLTLVSHIALMLHRFRLPGEVDGALA